MSTPSRWLVTVAVVAACLAGFGCESLNGDKDAEKERDRAERRERRARQREQDRLRDPDRPDPVIGRRDRAGDRRDRGIDEVPQTAERVDAGGDAGRLSYSPTRDGTLYVYDSDDGRVVYSGRVRQDERFVLDLDANRATVDGRTVLGTGLSPRHRYRLYFDRGRLD